MSESDEIIAILCSDIHLSHKPPVARSAEPDWYKAMARPLDELRALQKKYEVSIICAGDIFDRWNSPPELINFAMRKLPEIFTIPGQHDLPNHSIEEIRRSAYWTLSEANTICHVNSFLKITNCANRKVSINLHPFAWGSEIKPCHERWIGSSFNLAFIHEYCWTGEFCYPGAPKEQRLSSRRKVLKGYDAVVFGDNHKGFVRGNVCNCGSLIRRTIDEIDYKPFIGLLHHNGVIVQHFLDTSKDVFIEKEEQVEVNLPNMPKFIEELKGLGPDSLDFRSAIENYISQEGISEDTKEQVISILERQLK